MALLVKHVGQFGDHARAKQAGMLKDDIIVGWGETRDPRSETQLIESIINTKPTAKTPIEVLRGEKTLTLQLAPAK